MSETCLKVEVSAEGVHRKSFWFNLGEKSRSCSQDAGSVAEHGDHVIFVELAYASSSENAFFYSFEIRPFTLFRNRNAA